MAAAGESTKPTRLFYSYSHRDEDLRRRLQDHLAVLKWNGRIAEWNDRDIEAGAEWETEIDQHLSGADIILLLVSASFLASPYCQSVELNKALERHARGEARVIPVILRPCRWQSTPFARLQATPKDAKPVAAWPDPDAAFDDVVSKIEAVVCELQRKQALQAEASNAAHKEALVRRAETLAGSTNWRETSEALDGLVEEWKEIGSAGCEADEHLWAQFQVARQKSFDRYQEQEEKARHEVEQRTQQEAEASHKAERHARQEQEKRAKRAAEEQARQKATAIAKRQWKERAQKGVQEGPYADPYFVEIPGINQSSLVMLMRTVKQGKISKRFALLCILIQPFIVIIFALLSGK